MTTPSRKSVTVARLALGLGFFVFGLNGFLNFLPQPPMSGGAAAFAGALGATGYMFPFIKGTELLAGVLLLSGSYVPLALAVLGPVLLNILAFHLFLAPAGLGLPLVLLALELYLAFSYRAAFAPMLARKAESAAASSTRRTTPQRQQQVAA